MTTALYQANAAYPTTRSQGLRPLLTSWAHTFLSAQRWRNELNGMTDVELRDIGLTRGQIGAVADGRYQR